MHALSSDLVLSKGVLHMMAPNAKRLHRVFPHVACAALTHRELRRGFSCQRPWRLSSLRCFLYSCLDSLLYLFHISSSVSAGWPRCSIPSCRSCWSLLFCPRFSRGGSPPGSGGRWLDELGLPPFSSRGSTSSSSLLPSSSGYSPFWGPLSSHACLAGLLNGEVMFHIVLGCRVIVGVAPFGRGVLSCLP